MAHTPGPWRVTEASHTSDCFVVSMPTNTTIGMVVIDNNGGMANAKLIAAAPDMLEALMAVFDFLNKDDVSRAPMFSDIARLSLTWFNGQVGDMIEKAIQKATE